MKIENLILFRKVCETHSISKVAEQNFISRSSLSAIIQSMEKELGFELLKRSKKGVVLTDNGQIIYEQSQNICKTYLSWLNLNKNPSTIKGTVVIGVNSYYARNLINDVILKCNDLFPNITLLLSIIPPGRNDLLFKDLKNNKLSFIFTPITSEEMISHFSEGSYSIDILCKSATKIIMRKDHPLSNKVSLELSDLNDLTYILSSYDSGSLMTKVLPYFKNSIRYADTPGILSCVENSDFVTVLASFSLVNVSINNYAIIPCRNIEDILSFSLVHPIEKNMSLAEKKVLDLFKHCFDTFINSLPENFVENELIL